MESPSTVITEVGIAVTSLSPSKIPEMHETCDPFPTSPALNPSHVITMTKHVPEASALVARDENHAGAEIRSHVAAAAETLFPMNTSNTFFAGYAHCAQEAIRYLMEEEGLPCSHPLIIGLYDHLSEHQKMLHIQYLLGSALDTGQQQQQQQQQQQPKRAIHECDTIKVTAEAEAEADSVSNEDAGLRELISNAFFDGVELGIGNKPTDIADDDEDVETSETSMENKERLAEAIAKQIFEMLQFDDSTEDDDLDDEGFAESAEF